jgi:uncharacterized membrane protein
LEKAQVAQQYQMELMATPALAVFCGYMVAVVAVPPILVVVARFVLSGQVQGQQERFHQLTQAMCNVCL